MVLRLREAKSIDTEYQANWSNIPREIFNQIINLDPQTNVANNVIGPSAKQLLLPKYLAGEESFLTDSEAVTAAINTFVNNRREYEIKNLAQFPSVEVFVNYVNDPQNTEVAAQEVKKESKIDKIYNQYYSDIPREAFDYLIDTDPQTNLNKDVLGEYAKNLIIPLYRKDVHAFDKYHADDIAKAIKAFEEHKSFYSAEQLMLSKYNSFEDFEQVALYGGTSDFLNYLRQKGYLDTGDIRHIGSTILYDVFEAVTHGGGAILAGAEEALGGPGLTSDGWSKRYSANSYGHWCTSGKQSYWDSTTYHGMHGENKYYVFIYKPNPLADDRAHNYQLAVEPSGGVASNADGVEHYGNNRLYAEKLFGEDPEVLRVLAKERTHGGLIDEVVALRDVEQFENYTYTGDATEIQLNARPDLIKKLIKVLTVSPEVERIPAMLFSNCTSLTEIHFNEGLKVIGPQAFKGCLVLRDFALPSTLEAIGSQAFMNCTNFSHTVRLPDNTVRIGRDAFKGTHATLSIPKTRPQGTLQIDPADLEWFDDNVNVVNEELNEEVLEENIPRDLADAYKQSTYFRRDSALGHNDIPKDTMKARRGTAIDFYNSTYTPISAPEAVQRVRQQPATIDHIRALWGDGVLELDLRNNGKPYPIVIPYTGRDNVFTRAMIQLGAPDAHIDDWVRHKVQSWTGLESVLDSADKIYWTDEYEHIIQPDSEIAQRRAYNNQSFTYYHKNPAWGQPEDPTQKYSWLTKSGAASTYGRQPDTGSHAQFGRGAEHTQLKSYRYLNKMLHNVIQNADQYDEEEFDLLVQDLQKRIDNVYKDYISIRTATRRSSDHQAVREFTGWVFEANDRMVAKIKELKERLEIAKQKASDLRDLQNNLAKVEAEIATDSPEYREHQEAIQEVTNNIEEAQSALANTQQEIEDAAAAIEELRRQIAEKEAQISTLQIESEDIANNILIMKSTVNDLITQSDEIVERVAQKNSKQIAEVEDSIEEIQDWFNNNPWAGKRFSKKKHRGTSDTARAMLDAPEEAEDTTSSDAV